jgi:hypothetical protein
MESGRGRPLNSLKDSAFRKLLDSPKQNGGKVERENHQVMLQKCS